MADRDADGKFVGGNPGGPGNPYAKRVGELRTALLDTVTREDMQAVAKALVDAANGGASASLDLTESSPGEEEVAVLDEGDNMHQQVWPLRMKG